MKAFVLLISLLMVCLRGLSDPSPDSLRKIWMRTDIPDSIRLQALDQKALDYLYSKPDSSVYFAQLTYELAEKIGRTHYMSLALYRQGVAYYVMRDYKTALDLSEQCLAMAEKYQDRRRISHALILAAAVTQEWGDYRKTIEYCLRSLQLAELEEDEKLLAILHVNIGLVYSLQGNSKKAIKYFSDGQQYFWKLGGYPKEIGEIYGHTGKAWLILQDYPKALDSYQHGYDTLLSINSERRMAEMQWGMGEAYRGLADFQRSLEAHQQGLRLFEKIEDPYGVAIGYLGIGKTQQAMGYYASAISWCKKALDATASIQNLAEQMEACDCLYQSYKALGRYQEALIYHEKQTVLLDSLQLKSTDKKLQEMEFVRILFADSLEHVKQIEIKNLEIEKQEAEISMQRIGIAGTTGGLVLVGIMAFLIFRGKKRADALAEERRQKNETISQQAQELEHTNLQLAESLDHLQQTQQQLILQEKMASLGQMTAGIAHEIKNPLNFVNNFAEGVDEIITEFGEDLSQYQQSQDPADFQLLVDTLADLRKYNQDILDHGKRADQIVNSMMDHANNKKGEKSPTDLNHLITTNLTLAQHGYLPQQEGFILKVTQDLDPAIPEITLNPQELGRVLINLVNNACHALEEKKASLGEGFQPAIHLSSRLKDGQVELRVRDNGPGIPEEIRKQIFQPFFTTKPTGQGNTGLGLSISYDIVRQGLRGQMAVESEVGDFTEFVLSFPID